MAPAIETNDTLGMKGLIGQPTAISGALDDVESGKTSYSKRHGRVSWYTSGIDVVHDPTSPTRWPEVDRVHLSFKPAAENRCRRTNTGQQLEN